MSQWQEGNEAIILVGEYDFLQGTEEGKQLEKLKQQSQKYYNHSDETLCKIRPLCKIVPSDWVKAIKTSCGKREWVTHISYFEEASEICYHVPVAEHDSLWVSCVIQKTHKSSYLHKGPYSVARGRSTLSRTTTTFYSYHLKTQE